MTDTSGPDRRTTREGSASPEASEQPRPLSFSGPEEWRAWLEAHHDTADELWTILYKKHAADRGLTWAQAVPEALCFGWIDSLARRIDDDTVRQRWTPRRPGSNWSQVNIDHVERLIAAGRMHPAGLAAYENRDTTRTGPYSYETGGTLSEEQRRILRADPAAEAFWSAAAPSYRRAAEHWVVSAKQEATRQRRLAQLTADCAAGRLIKPQRYGRTPAWLARAAEAARRARGG